MGFVIRCGDPPVGVNAQWRWCGVRAYGAPEDLPKPLRNPALGLPRGACFQLPQSMSSERMVRPTGSSDQRRRLRFGVLEDSSNQVMRARESSLDDMTDHGFSTGLHAPSRW